MADLVVLNQNPLAKISNTRDIHGVLMNGLYYDAKKIEELKAYTASIASSFHMNIKALYGLISSPLIRVQFAD